MSSLGEEIRSFIVNFYKHIRDLKKDEIEKDYLERFTRITHQYFKNSRWPSIEIISPLVNNDKLFIILYNEVYYRHLFAHLKDQQKPDDLRASYLNYLALFSHILNSDKPVPLQLPNQWLWDIIDEFIYQFINIRSSNDGREALKIHPKIWGIHEILNILHSIIEKSNINEQLQAYAAKREHEEVAGIFGRCDLYKMLGYFSIVGLTRIHCLLGDYYQAIKCVEYIDLNMQHMYQDVPMCQITTNYFVGFSYMMTHQYQDAIKLFSASVLFISRSIGNSIQNPDVNEYVSRKSDKMLCLLAVCLVLNPMQIDRNVEQTLRDKFGDALIRLQRGQVEEFATMFQMGCPRFISAAISEKYTCQDVQRQQLELFKHELVRQCELLQLRSFLKLYCNLSLPKLESLLTKTNSDLEVKEYLMMFKQNILKMSDSRPGSKSSSADLELNFYIDNETVHVADTKIDRKFSEYFIKQIEHMETLNAGLEKLELKMCNAESNDGYRY